MLPTPKRKSVQPLHSLEKIQQHKLHIQQLTEKHFPLLSSTLPSPSLSYLSQDNNNNINNKQICDNINDKITHDNINIHNNNNDNKNDVCSQMKFNQEQQEINNYIKLIVQKLDFPSSFDHSYELSNMTSLATKQLQLVQQKQTEIISTYSQPSPTKKKLSSLNDDFKNESNCNKKNNANNNNDDNNNDNSPNKKIKNKINNKKTKKQSFVLKQQLSNSEEVNDQMTTRSASNENLSTQQMEQVISYQKRSYDSLDTIDTSAIYQNSPQKSTIHYYQNNFFSSNNIEDLKANISLITKQTTFLPQKPIQLTKSVSVPPSKATNINKINKNSINNNNCQNKIDSSNVSKLNRDSLDNNQYKQQQNLSYNFSSGDFEFSENRINQNNYEFNNIDSLFNDSIFMNSYNNCEKQKKKSCFDFEELDLLENINEIDFFNDNSQEVI